MANTYFNIADDKTLLHASVRDNSELQNVATQVEADILQHYRDRLRYYNKDGVPIWFWNFGFPELRLPTDIKLRGYAPDPANAEPGLKNALKKTIADVISHCLRYYDNDEGVTYERRGYRQTRYKKIPTKNDWPKNWDWRLAIYDSREKVYAV